MAQAVSGRPLTAEAWVRFEDISFRIFSEKNGNFNGFFLSVILFYTLTIILHTLRTHLHLVNLVPEEQTAKAWKT
jgi:hypothetical protein